LVRSKLKIVIKYDKVIKYNYLHLFGVLKKNGMGLADQLKASHSVPHFDLHK